MHNLTYVYRTEFDEIGLTFSSPHIPFTVSVPWAILPFPCDPFSLSVPRSRLLLSCPIHCLPRASVSSPQVPLNLSVPRSGLLRTQPIASVCSQKQFPLRLSRIPLTDCTSRLSASLYIFSFLLSLEPVFSCLHVPFCPSSRCSSLMHPSLFPATST